MKYLLVALPLFAAQLAPQFADAKPHKNYARAEDRQMSASDAGAPKSSTRGGWMSWTQAPVTPDPDRASNANGA